MFFSTHNCVSKLIQQVEQIIRAIGVCKLEPLDSITFLSLGKLLGKVLDAKAQSQQDTAAVLGRYDCFD